MKLTLSRFLFLPALCLFTASLLLATGVLDQSFGSSGVVSSGDFVYTNWAEGGKELIVMPNGKFVVIGNLVINQIQKVRLAGYN
ncbi:MAG: hypothetical protein ACKN97_05990, partial [Acidobacteriota bacterium]